MIWYIASRGDFVFLEKQTSWDVWSTLYEFFSFQFEKESQYGERVREFVLSYL